ncbi:MAG TPA: TonB-dependent receptor [Steroidobacteraceae bacterium]|nr:TonB-dependent receptor [Steroidobacteraceae bacterium]
MFRIRRAIGAFTAGACLAGSGGQVMAADPDTTVPAPAPTPELAEIVVTGSSIAQRLDSSSLPVTLISSEEIAKSGFTSATDLLQNLPGMQGFVPASSSVNGAGDGVTTAAVHSLPSKYTLVLLDGQRVAGFDLSAVAGEGFGVNLNSIPLDAIERVEVLTDGASALYGADAIAGVVNFILKKDQTDGRVFYNSSIPSQSGGGAWNAGLSKGFGSLSDDGWNILFTFSHDVQDKVEASQRAISSRGAFFPFSSNGTNYIFNNQTSNTEPANVTIPALGVSYNPYYQTMGNCGQGALASPLTVGGNTTCRFNYAATVEDIPASTRDSGLLKATFDLHDGGRVWGEAVISQFDLTSQYAAPAQPFPISPTDPSTAALYNAYVQPYLTATGQSAATTSCPQGCATLGYRAISAGGRTDDWQTKMRHIAVGWDASYFGWDFKAAAVNSHGVLTDYGAGGYLDSAQFFSAIASGAYNPILATGTSSLSTAILHQEFEQKFSDVTTFSFGAQHKVFDLLGGPSILSLGAEYDKYKYQEAFSTLFLSQSTFSTQPVNPDYPIGGQYGSVPFEADRSNWGVFGEWLFPILKELNATASVRFDDYAKVHSDEIFAASPNPATGVTDQIASGKLGNTFSDTTFKLSFRYTPVDMVSFRGSVGTGFKAPNMTDIAGVLEFNGATSGSYACPFPGSPGCLPGSAQYDLLAGPNGQSGSNGLKPETSTQFGFGVRVDPISQLSVALDYWNVKIKNQVESQGIAEQVAFNNPSQYKYLFVNPYLDPAGFQTIGLEQVPFNGGEAQYSGIDLNANYHVDLGFGRFNAIWTGTYMLKQQYTDGPGLPELTDLGVYGPDQQVVFRIISNLELSLQTGDWVNTLMVHYKSGYRDESYAAGSNVVFLANPNGSLGAAVDFSGLQVPSYETFDWQTVYNIEKNIKLTAGVRNIADKAPPLSLQTGGGGNQTGYDGRYYDPIGRTFYVRGDVKF